jgi:hypothetical protein
MNNIENTITDFIIASPSGAYLFVLLGAFVTVCVVTSICQKIFTRTFRSESLKDMNPYMKLG